jgi:hypothetical protein
MTVTHKDHSDSATSKCSILGRESFTKDNQMRESLKVWAKLSEMLHLIWKNGMGTPGHVNVYVECGRLGVPDTIMRDALIRLAQRGQVRLTTWSNYLRREVDYREFATADAFFCNHDDANHVRVKPLVTF